MEEARPLAREGLVVLMLPIDVFKLRTPRVRLPVEVNLPAFCWNREGEEGSQRNTEYQVRFDWSKDKRIALNRVSFGRLPAVGHPRVLATPVIVLMKSSRARTRPDPRPLRGQPVRVALRAALASILGQDRDVPPYVRRNPKIAIQVDALEPPLQAEQPDQGRREEGKGKVVVGKERDVSQVNARYGTSSQCIYLFGYSR